MLCSQLQRWLLYMQRITISEVIENEWFKKGYQPLSFEAVEVDLDDVNDIFNESGVISSIIFVSFKMICLKSSCCYFHSTYSILIINLGTGKSCGGEKRGKTVFNERIWADFYISGPQSQYTFRKTNGWLVICMLDNFDNFSIKLMQCYEQGLVKRETRFASRLPANEILSKIEEAATPFGFKAKKNNYKVCFLLIPVLVFDFILTRCLPCRYTFSFTSTQQHLYLIVFASILSLYHLW